MKRLLLSILSGTLFVIGYFIFAEIVKSVFHLSYDMTLMVMMPLYFFWYIYVEILHLPLMVETPMQLMIMSGIINILLYTIFFYLFFLVIARITKKRKAEGIETPPPPPKFESK